MILEYQTTLKQQVNLLKYNFWLASYVASCLVWLLEAEMVDLHFKISKLEGSIKQWLILLNLITEKAQLAGVSGS